MHSQENEGHYLSNEFNLSPVAPITYQFGTDLDRTHVQCNHTIYGEDIVIYVIIDNHPLSLFN